MNARQIGGAHCDLEEMMLLKTGSSLACVLSVGAAFLLPSRAHAVLCDDLTLPNKVYGVGGSANTATLKKVAQAIIGDANKTNDRVSLLWNDALGACAGYQAFLTGKVTGQFHYWDSSDPKAADTSCDARAGGQPVSFAERRACGGHRRWYPRAVCVPRPDSPHPLS